jgi:hypothetical protein
MNTQSQPCPLCEAPAEFYLVDHGERKYFECASCTRFQISSRAEAKLAGAPQQWRADLAAKVQRTPAEHLLVITVPSPPAPEALSGQFLPKSELPL